nr:MAG TPA: hypothetical protein [Caudoviricetes sp.]DAH95951.1 MAG TPA: hypothetical protein [Caudoviricetes sp.]
MGSENLRQGRVGRLSTAKNFTLSCRRHKNFPAPL